MMIICIILGLWLWFLLWKTKLPHCVDKLKLVHTYPTIVGYVNRFAWRFIEKCSLQGSPKQLSIIYYGGGPTWCQFREVSSYN